MRLNAFGVHLSLCASDRDFVTKFQRKILSFPLKQEDSFNVAIFKKKK